MVIHYAVRLTTVIHYAVRLTTTVRAIKRNAIEYQHPLFARDDVTLGPLLSKEAHRLVVGYSINPGSERTRLVIVVQVDVNF